MERAALETYGLARGTRTLSAELRVWHKHIPVLRCPADVRAHAFVSGGGPVLEDPEEEIDAYGPSAGSRLVNSESRVSSHRVPVEGVPERAPSETESLVVNACDRDREE